MSNVPPHLRAFVVEQDYGQYIEQDQAVWRFVVLQTHERLLRTAHTAYGSGFDAAGISVERIPRIEEMHARLLQRGWSALCVDGFIPPRAFQAFQAAGILPIAADIRTSEHLTYTPAPDIIHEAAGHAPLLDEPSYARYLKRIGHVGGRAFATPQDRALYDAIFLLSEIKEDPASTPAQVRRAEQGFIAASQALGPVSEAAKVARLYWWTVEYGMVGSIAAPLLYGAGLLSSIGEGYHCQHPSIAKLPLTAACVDVSYDITRAQPQLFVVQDFEQLDLVLDEVASGLSQTVGGRAGLETALQCAELATLTLDTGIQVVGIVAALHGDGDEPVLVELSGRCSLAVDDVVLDAREPCEALVLPLGALADGTPLSSLSYDALRRRADASGRLALRLQQGVDVHGRLGEHFERAGRLLYVALHDCEVRHRGRTLVQSRAPYAWALGARVVSVAAGAALGHASPTEYSHVKVPKPRTFDAAQQALNALYERALAAVRTQGGLALQQACEQVVDALDAAYPDEWLLRWNILESLVKAAEAAPLQHRLAQDLERLELRYAHLEPIATGLGYVRALATSMGQTLRPASMGEDP